MRLDKFLSISMIFKTRSAAEKEIKNSNVMLNDKKAKSSSTVCIGDKIVIYFPFKEVEYEVVAIHEKNVAKKIAREMTKIIGEKRVEL